MIKRPLVWVLAAYLAGMYLAWLRSSVWIAAVWIGILLLVIYLLMYRIKNRWICHCDTFLWSLPFLLLLGYCSMGSQMKKPELYQAFEQEITCQLTGQVTMVVEKQWGRAIYVHNNLIILSGEDPYRCENVIVFCSDDQNYLVGNQITVSGTLQKFSKASNPGQFNEQLYYQIENIDFKMEAKSITVTDSGYSRYHLILGKIKNKLITTYAAILSDKEAGALIAMLLGEKYLLNDEIKQLYQENGISHLLAISGLHVSLIGMFVFGLLRRCKVPILPATFLAIFFIYSYGVLTNFSVSTNRAVMMMVVFLLSSLFGKTYDMLSSMALSAFLIFLQNPLQIFSAGFLLSYGAVLGIAVIFPCLKQLFQTKNSIIDSLLISTSAQITTTPFVLFFFYQFPTYGILTNLIILPFVTLLTLTSIFAGIAGAIYLPLGIFLIGGANYILRFYEWVCQIGSNLPWNLITVGKPDMLRELLYVLLTALFVLTVRHYNKKISILIPLAALIILAYPQANTDLEVTFLDVGQGDCIYMESKSNTTYLIDGGSTDVMNVGRYRIKPFLLSKGTDKLDYVIMTHSDSDHISGLTEIMEDGKMVIKNLILPDIANKDEAYLTLEALAKEKNIKVSYIKTGDELLDGDIHIFCLHPSSSYEAATSNAYSAVLSISYGNFDMLLTGDLQQDGEERITDLLQDPKLWKEYDNQLISNFSPAVDYDVLKVAHHGSKYSTSLEFLKLIQPEFSIISCGMDNSYGHPHEELLDRLDNIESDTMITYESGAITIWTDGRRMGVSEYRKCYK
ncbi:MAG TPA: DNA internalization-related competence protein ComEC/Rec2 [Mobilitalea sp.]|nr:DNA internalization-related competence protein ComEC/Rec2 [Mobilitalea sp.]